MDRDSTLISRFQKGDQKAFDQLVLAHQAKVRGFLLKATGDRDASDDLAQEIFIKVYRNLPKFRGGSSFSTWLYRIMVNVLKSHYRQNRIKSWFLPGSVLDSLPGESPGEFAEQRRDLAGALQKLPGRERQVMVLRGLQDLNVADTAAILGTSENSVKVSFHSAKQKLRDILR